MDVWPLRLVVDLMTAYICWHKLPTKQRQIKKAEHLQIHYTPHHPVTEDASVVCADPSETGYSSAN